ncbi:acyltransferase family protein [Solidesulfovibrio carbinolicus]|nr:acyltransferase [Solidesulfovibrio carbinolicus]
MGILRFILALSVVVGHADHSSGLPGLDTTLAVRSFYMISGFYMALVLSSKYKTKPYYVFICSRYMRLFPAYLAVLVLTVVYGFVTWAVVGSVQWPLAGWVHTVTGLSDSAIVGYALSNVFLFGQDILSFFNVAPDGRLVLDYLARYTDGPFGGYMLVPQAWTLGLELSFYLVAPFFIARSSLVIASVVAGSCLLRFAVFPWCGIEAERLGYRFFLFEIIFFCFGGLAYKLYAWERFRSLGGRVHGAVVLALAVPFLSFAWDVPEAARYAALALCIPSLFLLTRDSRLDRLVGELSYPIYISHILVLYALTQYTKMGDELPGVALTLVLSVLLYVFVERQAEERRKRIVDGPPRRWPTFTGAVTGASFVLAVVVLPFVGKAVFEREHLSRAAAFAAYDFLADAPDRIVLVGFDAPERNGANTWRWGLGSKSEMLFSLPKAANCTLTFQFFSLLQGQVVSIYCNGQLLEKVAMQKDEIVFRQYRLPLQKTNNVIRFMYDDWNGKDNAAPRVAPSDERPLAVCFNALTMAF